MYLVIVLSSIVVAYIAILASFLIYAAAVYEQSPFISTIRFLKRLPGKGDVRKLDLENMKTHELIEMVPEAGATVRIMILKSKTFYEEEPLDVLEADNITQIVQGTTFRGKHAFPWTGRIANGRYTYQGKVQQLATNENEFSTNGFLYDKGMNIMNMRQNQSAAFASFVYTTSGKEAGYPHKLEIKLSKSLTMGGFRCDVTVTNYGADVAPFSYAFLPFFEMVDPKDNLYLAIPSIENYDLDYDSIPTGNISTLQVYNKNSIPLGYGELNYCLRLKNKSNIIYVTTVRQPSAGIGIKVWQSSSFPFVRIQTTPTSILIAPSTSAPGALHNGIGLLEIQPGDAWTGSYGVFAL